MALIGRIALDGSLTGVRLVRTGNGALSPHGAADAVLDALRSWSFSPALLNGQPATIDLIVRVTFRAG